MYESIMTVLADGWMIFYHGRWPTGQLKPVCDLQRCLDQSNDLLDRYGLNLLRWPVAERYHAARLVRANWIYNRLPTEPIRKPLLVHAQDDDLVVDCGDTRLMALRLYDTHSQVAVVTTARAEHAGRYRAWVPITNDRDLLAHAGFHPDAEILVRTTSDGAIEWLEIGDQSTAHHLHDFDQRLRMLQRHLDLQSHSFRFSESWVRSFINWQDADQDLLTSS